MIIDRIFAIFLLVLAAFFGGLGTLIEVPFSYDPLGPKAFPVILGVLLAVLAIWVILKPEKVYFGEKQTLIRVSLLVFALVFYQQAFNRIGFLISTIIMVYFVSRMFRGKPVQAFISSLSVSFVVYGIFDFLLGIPLPVGTLLEKIIGK